MKELKFYNKDRDGNTKVCGSMTIKNQTDSSADLFFYFIGKFAFGSFPKEK